MPNCRSQMFLLVGSILFALTAHQASAAMPSASSEGRVGRAPVRPEDFYRLGSSVEPLTKLLGRADKLRPHEDYAILQMKLGLTPTLQAAQISLARELMTLPQEVRTWFLEPATKVISEALAHLIRTEEGEPPVQAFLNFLNEIHARYQPLSAEYSIEGAANVPGAGIIPSYTRLQEEFPNGPRFLPSDRTLEKVFQLTVLFILRTNYRIQEAITGLGMEAAAVRQKIAIYRPEAVDGSWSNFSEFLNELIDNSPWLSDIE